MIYNVLLFTVLLTFLVPFTLDFAATVHQVWEASAPANVPPEKSITSPVRIASAAVLPNPWDISTFKAFIPPAPAPEAPRPQLLLAPAKESVVSAATIASKAPQTSDDYNRVLTVEQLRKKAKQAGIKNFGRMKKNQLLAALAGG